VAAALGILVATFYATVQRLNRTVFTALGMIRICVCFLIWSVSERNGMNEFWNGTNEKPGKSRKTGGQSRNFCIEFHEVLSVPCSPFFPTATRFKAPCGVQKVCTFFCPAPPL
jgi:hypothetical protein